MFNPCFRDFRERAVNSTQKALGLYRAETHATPQKEVGHHVNSNEQTETKVNLVTFS